MLGGEAAAALPYLQSIAGLCPGEDALPWNTGMAAAEARLWPEAEFALLEVSGPSLTAHPAYLACLARAYVANGA